MTNDKVSVCHQRSASSQARSARSFVIRDNGAMSQTLTITRPDDWHLHVRDGAAMACVVPHSAAQFARALIMPNLRPPVTTAALAAAYRERILAATPQGTRFQPLMSLYLTDKLAPEE